MKAVEKELAGLTATVSEWERRGIKRAASAASVGSDDGSARVLDAAAGKGGMKLHPLPLRIEMLVPMRLATVVAQKVPAFSTPQDGSFGKQASTLEQAHLATPLLPTR